MIRAFRSELIKLRRPGALGTPAAMLLLALIGIPLELHRISTFHGLRALSEHLLLGAADGWAALELPLAEIFGAVALVSMCASVASEWSQGTLRVILGRQPRRLTLLAGKVTAQIMFVLVSAVVALAMGAIEGLVLAPHAGLDTSAWTSSTGITDLVEFTLDCLLALVGWSALALLVATATRSVAASVGISVIYGLAVEVLIQQVLPSVAQWLPAHLLSDVAAGGTSTVSIGAAIGYAGLYSIGFVLLAAALFRWRDVTA